MESVGVSDGENGNEEFAGGNQDSEDASNGNRGENDDDVMMNGGSYQAATKYKFENINRIEDSND
jgi:hypothetical protein